MRARGHWRSLLGAIWGILLLLGLSSETRAEPVVLDGVTYAVSPGTLYVPIREVAAALDWQARWNAAEQSPYLNGKPVPNDSTRILGDGTRVVSVRDLETWGAQVRWNAEQQAAVIRAGDREVQVRPGEKRVVIDRGTQEMKAWQGERLVLTTRVSTGKPGHETPLGTFKAGPYKARMHRSSLYDNAPMPFSVQVQGNVFIHGFASVPPRAASHGCIRVPLTGANPARWFFEWVEVGTPIEIVEN